MQHTISIKPNNVKKSDVFDNKIVLEQLRYCGVFEAVSIRKKGYPFRYNHINFWNRFHCLMNSKDKLLISSTLKNENGKKKCQELLNSASKLLSIDDDKDLFNECHVGQTMVLYKSIQHRWFEAKRILLRNKYAIICQQIIRGGIVKSIINPLVKAHKKLFKLMSTTAVANDTTSDTTSNGTASATAETTTSSGADGSGLTIRDIEELQSVIDLYVPISPSIMNRTICKLLYTKGTEILSKLMKHQQLEKELLNIMTTVNGLAMIEQNEVLSNVLKQAQECGFKDQTSQVLTQANERHTNVTIVINASSVLQTAIEQRDSQELTNSIDQLSAARLALPLLVDYKTSLVEKGLQLKQEIELEIELVSKQLVGKF